MHRRSLWWLSALVLVALATLAAVAAAPPNLAKTLESQRRLSTERPNDAGVFNDLGNLYQLAHKPAEAEAAYRRAVELDPERVSALFNLGLLLQEKGERREAVQLYKRAVKAEPRHAWAHYQLGTLYEAAGNEGNAIESYAQAFALDPQLAFPQVNPQIVDNKLVTQAMLRAYRSDYAPTQAPKIYDEPGRIASLLVKNPQAAPPAAKGAAPAPAGAAPTPTASGTAAPGSGTGQPAGTVLRPQDLSPTGATGQVQGQGSVRNPYAGGVRTTVPQPTLREWNRPDPEGRGEVPSEDSEEGIQPGPPQVAPPPPPGAYYRPGLPSTSRLNLEVMPARGRAARTLRGTR